MNIALFGKALNKDFKVFSLLGSFRRSNCALFLIRNNTNKAREGFGSFHSDDVEVLIRQTSNEYCVPKLFDEIRKHTTDTTDKKQFNKQEELQFGCNVKKSLFAIDKNWTFINHGAFGGSLKHLLYEANQWRYYCESQPLRFFDRELLSCLVYCLREISHFLNCHPWALIPLPNVTSGLNSVINSIPLNKGDEVLCTSLTYGSTKKILKHVCLKTGAVYNQVELPLPIISPEDMITKFSNAMSNRVKLVIIDQITSNTGICMPIRELSQIAKQHGAIVIIDAAHSLFSQDININDDIRSYADAWLTNGHKWFSAPKGCAFMWISPRLSNTLIPPILSHGFSPTINHLGQESVYQDPNRLLSGYIWDGCRDYCAMLTIPSAVMFWNKTTLLLPLGGIAGCRQYNKELLQQATALIVEEWDIKPEDFAAPISMTRDSPMSLIPLPQIVAGRSTREGVTDKDAFGIQEELHHKHAIEVPIKCLEGKLYVRISAHIYNELKDYSHLATVVKNM